jgi:hypothetical protein
LLIIATLWIISFSFQKEARKELRDYIQSTVGADFTYDRAKVSLLRNFPRIRLEINDITVYDSTDESLKIGKMTVLFNFRKIFNDTLDIEKIILRDACLDLVTNPAGRQTKLIRPPDGQAKTKKSISISSQEIKLVNFTLFKRNQIKHNLLKISIKSGEFFVGIAKPVTLLHGKVTGTLDSLITGNKTILSNLKVQADDLLYTINDSTGIQCLEQGKIKAGDIDITPYYKLEKSDSNKVIDLSLSCENDLNAILSIFNIKQELDLKQVNPDARAKLEYRETGIVTADKNPYTELDFEINSARIEGKKLPFPINDLNIKGNYNNGPEHTHKTACIRIDTLHADLDDSFIYGSALISDLSAPDIHAKLNASADLGKLIKPTPKFTIKGTAEAKLNIEGRLSDLSKNGIRDKDFAAGELDFHNLELLINDSSYRVQFREGKITLTDQALNLSRTEGMINGIPISLSGYADNLDQLMFKSSALGVLYAGFNESDSLVITYSWKPDTLEMQAGLHMASFDFLKKPFRNINADADISNNNIIINTLKASMAEGNLEMDDIRIENWQSSDRSLSGQIHLIFDSLDVRSFLASFPGKNNPDIVSSLPHRKSEIHTSWKTNLNLLVEANKLSYEEVNLDSIKLSANTDGDKLDINRFSFRFAGGTVSLEGKFRSNANHTYSGNLVSDATKVDISKALDSFGNFDQTFLTSGNISGLVSWNADLFFGLDSTFRLIDPENLWIFSFDISDAQLSDLVPIENSLAFIRQKSRENILISHLDFKACFTDHHLYFQNVTIKNSISDMIISGLYSPKDTIVDLNLKISLSDLLFKSLKKRTIETEEGLYDVGKDHDLNLKFLGTMGNHQVKLLSRKEYQAQKQDMQNRFDRFDSELKTTKSGLYNP